MKQVSNFSGGFTLIELLVVIGIIGILSTIGLSSYSGVRNRSRDAQRKSDVRQIQSGVELYRADVGNYPLTGIADQSSLKSPSGTVTYIQKMPREPAGPSLNGGNYYYVSDGTTYTIAACLENANDTQGTTSFAPPPWTCPSGLNFVIQNP